MKKVLGILVLVLGVIAFVVFLVVTKNMAEKRAERLDLALIEAETRIMELEGDLQAATAHAAAVPATVQPAPQAPAQSPAVGNTPTLSVTATAAPGARVLFAATAGHGITNMV